MRYLSVCSGIEAATVAWHPLGWEVAAFSEIEAFPRSVLAHHYPEVPLHGDFTTIGADDYGPIDLLVGGTPCQSFSVAGLRKGLADERGNLALEYLRLADRKSARWLVWENVPGVLSSSGGRDFAAFLGGLVELGYGFAYRVLDAQFFGVAQRRRRVFVVGYLGDWRRPAAVLFERHSLSGHPAPRREKGQGVAGTLKACSGKSGTPNGAEEADRLIATFDRQSSGEYGTSPVASTVSARDFKGPSDLISFGWQNSPSQGDGVSEEYCATLDKSKTPAVAFQQNVRNEVRLMGGDGAIAGALQAESGMKQQNYIAASAVRRLTPVECERLQGFPDDYTAVPHRGKPAADGPRYKALGNSMAVPVMAWIGQRIAQVETLTALKEAA